MQRLFTLIMCTCTLCALFAQRPVDPTLPWGKNLIEDVKKIPYNVDDTSSKVIFKDNAIGVYSITNKTSRLTLYLQVDSANIWNDTDYSYAKFKLTGDLSYTKQSYVVCSQSTPWWWDASYFQLNKEYLDYDKPVKSDSTYTLYIHLELTNYNPKDTLWINNLGMYLTPGDIWHYDTSLIKIVNPENGTVEYPKEEKDLYEGERVYISATPKKGYYVKENYVDYIDKTGTKTITFEPYKGVVKLEKNACYGYIYMGDNRFNYDPYKDGYYWYRDSLILVAREYSIPFDKWSDGDTSKTKIIKGDGRDTIRIKALYRTDKEKKIILNVNDPKMGSIHTEEYHNTKCKWGADTINTLTEIRLAQDSFYFYAVENEGYEFVKWNNGSKYKYQYVLIDSSELYVEAIFQEKDTTKYNIVVMSADTTMGEASGGGKFTKYDKLKLSYNAKEGYKFVSWKSVKKSVSMTQYNTGNYKINENDTIIAEFERIVTKLNLRKFKDAKRTESDTLHNPNIYYDYYGHDYCGQRYHIDTLLPTFENEIIVHSAKKGSNIVVSNPDTILYFDYGDTITLTASQSKGNILDRWVYEDEDGWRQYSTASKIQINCNDEHKYAECTYFEISRVRISKQVFSDDWDSIPDPYNIPLTVRIKGENREFTLFEADTCITQNSGDTLLLYHGTKDSLKFSHWQHTNSLAFTRENPLELVCNRPYLYVEASYQKENSIARYNYYVNTSSNDITLGETEGTGLYTFFDTARIVAYPKNNAEFSYWSGDTSEIVIGNIFSREIYVNSTRDISLIANFAESTSIEEIQTIQLNVSLINNILTISSENEINSIKLIAPSGTIILNEEINSTYFSKNINYVANGIYILEIKSSGQTYKTKIIKK